MKAMILGILSDTHHDTAQAIPHVVAEFQRRGVELIFHCGDIVRGRNYAVLTLPTTEVLFSSISPPALPPLRG
jgi:predicted phosphodiesterase